MPFRCARGAYTCNEEPRLDELLGEDAVRLVMARDGWTEARRSGCSRHGCAHRSRKQLRLRIVRLIREAISSDVALPVFSFAVGLLRSVLDDFPRTQLCCGACK
jgi:hypothetical protein